MLIFGKAEGARLGKALLSFLYIPRCLGCDDLLEFEEYERRFCKKCARQLQFIGDHSCMVCGKRLQKETTQTLCRDCEKKRHVFVQNKAVLLYKGCIKKTMYRLKYYNRRDYAEILAKMAARQYRDWVMETGVECIIAVPMYARKKRRRGYNQAEVLGEALAKELHLPFYKKTIVRNRNTRPQKGLGTLERKNNLKNAFNIRKNDVKLKKILLIDDIYTTGSTLDEVSRVLLGSGAAAVYGLCLCAGADYGGKGYGCTEL